MTDEEFVKAHWVMTHICDGSYRHYQRGTILLQDVNHHFFDFPDWPAAAEFTRERLEEIRQLEAEVDLVAEGWNGWNNALNEARGRIWVDDVVIVIRTMRILSRLEFLLAEARLGMKTDTRHAK